VNDDELLTPAETAELMRTTLQSLGQQRYQRRGPKYVKIGSRVLYRRSDIREYLDSRTVQTN
jgi:hypothetical protein